MKFFIKAILFSYFLLLTNLSATGFDKNSFEAKELASFNGIIWGMDFLTEDKLIVTLKSGEIKTYDLKSKQVKDIDHELFIFNNGQGGLLDVKASPNYSNDKTIYFTYSKDYQAQGATTLISAKVKNNSLIQVKELLQTKSLSSKGYHFGSRITFDTKGNLYFSVGDRGTRDTAQNLKNHAGTIIRLKLNGDIPKDNPFVNNSNALDEIFSYGHRNPQGLFYDKRRNILLSIEHGPRGGDEINIIKKGKNYGWPVISYGEEYWAPISVGEGTHKEGMEQPLKYYDPSIAPSSLIVYQGDYYKGLKGAVLSTALKLRHLNIVFLDKNLKPKDEYRVLNELNERFRNIVEDSNGKLYLSTDTGKLLVLEQN